MALLSVQCHPRSGLPALPCGRNQLIDCESRTDGRFDQLQATGNEMFLQFGNHTHFGPRTPGNGDNPARPLAIEIASQLAQYLVGRRVIRLPSVAVTAGDGGEQLEERSEE